MYVQANANAKLSYNIQEKGVYRPIPGHGRADTEQ